MGYSRGSVQEWLREGHHPGIYWLTESVTGESAVTGFGCLESAVTEFDRFEKFGHWELAFIGLYYCQFPVTLDSRLVCVIRCGCIKVKQILESRVLLLCYDSCYHCRYNHCSRLYQYYIRRKYRYFHIVVICFVYRGFCASYKMQHHLV